MEAGLDRLRDREYRVEFPPQSSEEVDGPKKTSRGSECGGRGRVTDGNAALMSTAFSTIALLTALTFSASAQQSPVADQAFPASTALAESVSPDSLDSLSDLVPPGH